VPWNPTSRENERDAPNFLYAALDKTACALFLKERRMKFIEAPEPHRKSGMWGTRDLVAWKERHPGRFLQDFVGW
jgi:hypothetical protein